MNLTALKKKPKKTCESKMMHDRTSEIKLDEEFTVEDWKVNCKMLDSVLVLVEKDKRKDLEDFWIAKINARKEIQADEDVKPHLTVTGVKKAGVKNLLKTMWTALDSSTDVTAENIRNRFRKRDFKIKNPLDLTFGLTKLERKVLKIISSKYSWWTAQQMANKYKFDEQKVALVLQNFDKKNFLEQQTKDGVKQWRAIIKS